MLWFILIFFSVYTIMHAYVFFSKIKPLLSHEKLKKALIFFMILLILSPLLLRYGDEYTSPKISYVLALGALLWMGFLIYLFFFSLVYDILKLPIKKFLNLRASPKKENWALILISLVFSIYSYYETKKLEVIRIKIETCKLPKNVETLKILQISDLHLGPVMGRDKIKVVKKVWLQEKPDIIVSTGDIVDGNMRKKDDLAEKFRKINAPCGKYAVLGNHEYYRGLKQAIEFTEKAGFKILKNEFVNVGDILFIVGLDDKTCKYFNACNPHFDEVKFLKKLPQDKFILLLKHQPEIKKEAVGFFDLMLSGHTHGGLYKPIGAFIMHKIYELDRGLKHLGKGTYLFVSKGVGTGGPPMRFLTPPDVSIIELINCKTHEVRLK